jgi:hypothetical protein
MEKHMKLKLNFSHYLLLGLAFLDRWTHSWNINKKET